MWHYGLPFQWVATVYWSSVHDIHPFPNTPHTVDWGCPVERALVLPCSRDMVDPGHMLLPLCPKAIACHWDPSSRPHPALLAKVGTLLLVVLLAVGNTADGAMGRAFVDVLVWHFLFLPVRPILGQCPTEAASQSARGRHRDGEEGLLLGSWCRRWDRLLVCLTQRLGSPGSIVCLEGLEAALDRDGSSVPGPLWGLHSRLRGESRGVKRPSRHLQGGQVIQVYTQQGLKPALVSKCDINFY